jgi:F0F1-type ATP synthase membrane subunit c/vacuolar-type H+-ATPase subunit K
MSPVWALVLKVLVVAALGAIAVFVGSPTVTWLFRRVDATAAKAAAKTKTATDAAEDSPAAAPRLQSAAALLRGGHWIGLLERLAIFATLLAGFGEGIAVVLAVKSLARYPELRAPSSGTAERFIIGTFASTLFAAACAGLAWWLIGLW